MTQRMRTEKITEADPLDDFELHRFTHNGDTRPVYRKGEGPGIVVISEVPGITPYVADFARRVVDAGFTVAMPDILGKAGKPQSKTYQARVLASACISREFSVLAGRGTSPIVTWLRGLARDLHERCGGPGVGAIGMCLTGNFALAMAVDPELLAPVLSQPSLPLLPHQRSELHISDEDLAEVKRRVADEGLQVMGLRFRRDAACPGARFDRLQDELGDGFIRVELDPGDANPRGRPMPPHSVVTTDCIDADGEPTHAALQQVLDLFRRRLTPA